MPTTTACLWFDDLGEEAAEFYVSVFPNSKITSVSRYGADNPEREGQAFTVNFELDGREFMALNAGPMFTFNEAVSFMIHTETQEETDRYWYALLADGGEESMCGWLKDRFGLSWQVTPNRLLELTTDPDPARAQRALQAMYKMRRIDIAALEAAAAG